VSLCIYDTLIQFVQAVVSSGICNTTVFLSCDDLMDSLLKRKNNLVRKKQNCSGDENWFKDPQNLEEEIRPAKSEMCDTLCCDLRWVCVCVCVWVVALTIQMQWERRASEFSWLRATHTHTHTLKSDSSPPYHIICDPGPQNQTILLNVDEQIIRRLNK